jgi:transglutaminase-like putative cysteine protease
MVTETTASRATARLRSAAVALALIALAMCAGLVFARIYHGPALYQLVIGAAVASVGLSALLRAVRVSPSLAVLTSVAALAGYLVLAAVLTRDPDAGTLGTVYLDALRNSGARILTSTFPVEPAPDTVFLPIMVVWAAGLAGAEVAIRGGRLVLGFVPPALAYGLALAFVGPNARPSVWLALAFLAVAAAATALTREDTNAAGWRQLPAGERAAYRGRGAAIGATALAALLGATVGIGTAVAALRDEPPKDPRTYVSPPEQEEPESNPLGRLSGWARQPDQHLFDVTMTAPNRIRWVVLNDYDGLNWTPQGRYRSAGTVLPVSNPPGGRTTGTVRQDVTIAELDGVWLPAVEQAHQITGVRVSYDADTGTVLQPNGLEPGLRYEVESEALAAAEPDRVKLASPPAGPAFDRFRAVPPKAPEKIREMAEKVTSKSANPYTKALLIEDHLSKQYRFVPAAPSGHGYANLDFFLQGSAEQGGGRGTSEQFATAFAVLARMVGLPTRVVMGFHAGRSRGDQTYRVNSGDAFAWPEVFFTGQGWVGFDPTPAAGENVERPPDEQTAEAEKQKQAKAEQLDAIEEEEVEPPTELEPVEQPAPEKRLSTTAKVGIGAGAALLILLAIPLVLLLLRRRVRKRRLTSGTPSQRVVGAWWELLDALQLGRRAPAPHLAAAEVATVAATPVPKRPAPLPPVDELAALVNMVAFAPGLAEDDHAARAADVAGAYTAALRAQRSWWRRWLWSVDPRPLFWRKRREAVPAGVPAPADPPPPSAPQEGVSAGAFEPPRRRVQTESEFASVSTDRAAATTKQ